MSTPLLALMIPLADRETPLGRVWRETAPQISRRRWAVSEQPASAPMAWESDPPAAVAVLPEQEGRWPPDLVRALERWSTARADGELFLLFRDGVSYERVLAPEWPKHRARSASGAFPLLPGGA